MSNLYESKDTISYLRNFQRITQTYQEIAAARMQRVKTSVLQNREYLEEIRTIYHEVVFSYQEYINNQIKKEESPVTTKKPLTVLLSSNTKLYGSIIKDVFEKFLEYIKANDVEILIAGKTGKKLFDESKSQKQYTYVELPDDIVSPEALSGIITTLTNYKEIIVFHGQFEDILTQIVKKTAISPETAYKQSISDNAKINHYLFEPKLEDILLFFEKEIVGSLFVQTVNESNLSKFTARMITLDTTSNNISSKIVELANNIRVLEHANFNRKQLQQLSGLSLWNN